MRIVHQIPGRLRLRVPESVDGARLAETLERLPGVHSAVWSDRTRSLLIVHDAEPSSAEAIIEALDEHGPVAAPLPGVPAAPDDSRTVLARAVSDGFAELDGRVTRATRGVVGLGGLVPILFLLWAARELALGRPARLAWTNALWYAHGLFRDYNAPRR